MCESAMDVGAGVQQIIESKAAEHGDQQDAPGDVPHPPERWEVSGVEQLLRGKIPGIPG
jgi:hypothetical protein